MHSDIINFYADVIRFILPDSKIEWIEEETGNISAKSMLTIKVHYKENTLRVQKLIGTIYPEGDAKDAFQEMISHALLRRERELSGQTYKQLIK